MTEVAATLPPSSPRAHAHFDRLWAEIESVGHSSTTGGYNRFVWSPEDLALREWFLGAARGIGLDTTTDRNGNMWAWWGDPDAAADNGDAGLVIGSHLDSVPSGGAFDGPLGVISSLAAIAELRAQGFTPRRPIAVACFADEEGARFGVACGGSRLLTGALDAERARGLRDGTGTSLGEAAAAAGARPEFFGRDEESLRRIGTFIELHVEQGRGLVDLDSTLAVATEVLPHGRWRARLSGRADHAGTTLLADRDDPMLPLAELILDARRAATEHHCVATVGKVLIEPGAVNAIPAHVDAWIDSRGVDEARVRALIADLARTRELIEESWTDSSPFDRSLLAQLRAAVAPAAGVSSAHEVPMLASGAGHDAGILANAGIPSGMIFVRNPSGTSHSPEEFAERSDCHAGVDGLIGAVRRLAS